ncbi:alanine racemase [Rhodobacterales bacterium HKCCE2091]|nr:alanine racemase [Rhodobacterales bacterium HKCCE2091]
MATGILDIDLGAIARNWRALDAMSTAETSAVVKADAYGLGLSRVAPALAAAGARRFFVAVAEEGVTLRGILGHAPEIFILGGHMAGDTQALRDARLVPMLNAPEQVARHRDSLPDAPFGIQLDTGMNRLGLEPADWAALRDGPSPVLVMSHLACADEPGHPQNAAQLRSFREMTAEVSAPLSLAATGGILLGPDYHFDLTRPGVGLYGGLPFEAAEPVARLALPVIQVREIAAGESVGYGASFVAGRPERIATVSGGYADGLLRSQSGRGHLYAGNIACPIAGRVSMDLIGVVVTHLDTVPDRLDMLGPHQGVDAVADAAGTIGYEVLTSLGARYHRRYTG